MHCWCSAHRGHAPGPLQGDGVTECARLCRMRADAVRHLAQPGPQHLPGRAGLGAEQAQPGDRQLHRRLGAGAAAEPVALPDRGLAVRRQRQPRPHPGDARACMPQRQSLHLQPPASAVSVTEPSCFRQRCDGDCNAGNTEGGWHASSAPKQSTASCRASHRAVPPAAVRRCRPASSRWMPWASRCSPS
jgi:hypothetical protein